MAGTDDVTLELSADRLEAAVRIPTQLAASAEPGGDLCREVRGLMAGDGVAGELDEEGLIEALGAASEEGLDTLEWIVAQGTVPRAGVNGHLIRHFQANAEDDEETDPSEPEYDGPIDFKDVSTVQVAAEGDLLVTVVAARPGVDGTDVFGGVIVAPGSESPRVLPGTGTQLDESGLELRATTDGLIEENPDNNQISVLPLYQVDGNVDMDVGHIDFRGSVLIIGNVEMGFRVKATEDVMVGGTISNAEIRAGGNLVVHGGVVGDGRTRLEAGGWADIGFIEDSTLVAGGDVNIQKYCLRTHITSGGQIKAVVGAGTVVLGSLSATAGIELNTAGLSGSGTQLNIRPVARDEAMLTELRQELLARTRELADLVRMHGPLLIKDISQHPEHADSLPQDIRGEVVEIAGKFSETLTRRQKITRKMTRIMEAACAKLTARIVVHRRAHVATVISFPGGERLKLDRSTGGVEYFVDQENGKLLTVPREG